MDTQAHDGHAHHDQPAPMRSGGLKDPVCGMAVTDQSQHRLEHDGRPYYFCSAKCQAKFGADPARYIEPRLLGQPADPTPPAAPPGTVYTCPMHPEIRQDRPGNCPKCGMTLEPVLPALEGDESPELVAFQRLSLIHI